MFNLCKVLEALLFSTSEPLSIKDILSEKNFVTVVAKLYNPKKMTSIARLLKLSSEEHHNMFVEPDEPAPEHFYNKFLSK